MNRRGFIGTIVALAATPFIGKLPVVRAPIDKDWVIERATGNIRYTGQKSGAKYTVLEFHRWLQDQADDIPGPDTQLDITDINPSIRRTDQIITLQGHFNIDDHAAEQLRGGCVVQDEGDESKAVYYDSSMTKFNHLEKYGKSA